MSNFHSDTQAVCRGCGRVMEGKPYHLGGSAHFTDARGRRQTAKSCHYGGYVCSESCDRRACLALEQTMPGHGFDQQRLDGNLDSVITRRWSNP